LIVKKFAVDVLDFGRDGRVIVYQFEFADARSQAFNFLIRRLLPARLEDDAGQQTQGGTERTCCFTFHLNFSLQ